MVYDNKEASCVELYTVQLAVEKEVYGGVLSVFVPGPTSSYLQAKDVINQRNPDVSQFPRSHDTGFTKTCITIPVFTLEGYGEASHLTKYRYLPNYTTSRTIKSGICTDAGKNLKSHVRFCVRNMPSLGTATGHRHLEPPLGTATGPFLN
jgi:hypothetical protein